MRRGESLLCISAPAPSATVRSSYHRISLLGLPGLHLIRIIVVAIAQVIDGVANRKRPGIRLPLPHVRQLVAQQRRCRANRGMHDDRPTQCHRRRRPAHSREHTRNRRQPGGLAQRDAVRQRLRRRRPPWKCEPNDLLYYFAPAPLLPCTPARQFTAPFSPSFAPARSR